MGDSSAFLAIDIGAGSGRAVVGRLTEGRLELEEVHRFDSLAVRTSDGLYVDVLSLHREIVRSIQLALEVAPIVSLGIDTWGVTCAVLDRGMALLGNPVFYRDERVVGTAELVYATLPKERLYAMTGVQELPFNTGFMLNALQAGGHLDGAAHVLMLPDALALLLTGTAMVERTNASTTQLYDPRQRTWSADAIAGMGLDPQWFTLPFVDPGMVIGETAASVLPQAAHRPRVIAVGSHDTASAVVAVPAIGHGWSYISCGTWSLIGVERATPVLTAEAMASNVTNEVGVDDTIRLLRNVSGLWLLQESQRWWASQSLSRSHQDMVDLAEGAVPLGSLFDPDDPALLAPGDMPSRVRALCARHGEPVPGTDGALIRGMLESTALRYNEVLDRIALVTGEQIDTVHIVGGGSKNRLLCQLTADACRRTVVAGPAEATAIGNILVQARAAGLVSDLATMREVVRASFPVEHYLPAADQLPWERARARFAQLPGRVSL